jgi:hypothetical protein
LLLRAAALAFWIACVVVIFVPMGGHATTPFEGGQPFHPKYVPARSL